MKKTRIVFMGTGNFAAPSLQILIDRSDYEVIAVYTQPARTSGRGRKNIVENPIRTIAKKEKLALFDPHEKLSDSAVFASLENLHPDIIIVASYGKILPQMILDLPQYGCLNLHASLLPRWRGATPVHSAIRAGDTQTGVTLMKMDAGLDTGAIIAQNTRKITDTIHTPELLDLLAQDATQLLSAALPDYLAGTLSPQEQVHDSMTICRTLTRDNGRIDWNSTAREIYNHSRAFDPWPGVFTLWQQEKKLVRLKLSTISYRLEHTNRKYGNVTCDGTTVSIATTNGTIIIHTIQPEGKQVMDIKDFINGAQNFCNATLL